MLYSCISNGRCRECLVADEQALPRAQQRRKSYPTSCGSKIEGFLLRNIRRKETSGFGVYFKHCPSSQWPSRSDSRNGNPNRICAFLACSRSNSGGRDTTLGSYRDIQKAWK